MRSNLLRGVLYAASSTLLLSCADVTTSPRSIAGSSVSSATAAAAPGAKVVISQVYGGGGLSGAAYQNDFVELFNAGTAPADLTDWSVQYASAQGTGAFGGSTSQLAKISGILAPGQYYLVKGRSSGTVGSVVAAWDTAAATLDLSGTNGKVALVNQNVSLGCNGGSSPCSDEQKAKIVDLVGYGTSASAGANFYEGTAAAPTLTNGTAAIRRANGCTDTNNNSLDFTSGAPSPRSKLSAFNTCEVVVSPFTSVVVDDATASSGSRVTLTADLRDATNTSMSSAGATITWTSGNDAIAKLVSTSGNQATFDALGGGGSVEIAISATLGSITKTTTARITVVGPLDHVVVTGPATVAAGSSIVLTATLKDAIDQTIVDNAATYTWTSADAATAQVLSTSGNTATIKGLVAGGPITISLTAKSNGVEKSPATQPTVIVTGPPTIVPSTTFLSEIHYDNTGTDAGEAVEIEGNAGTSLNGWTLYLYDGNGGKLYGTPTTLSGTFPATCGNRGVLVFNFPVNGLQNGSPDGWALVNPQNQVTEFRSYEGTMTAVDGPANGLTSTPLDADESVAPGANRSIQRAGTGVWFGPYSSTFGACNSPEPLGAQGSITLTSGKTSLALGMQTQFFYSGTDAAGQPVTSVTYSTSNTDVITVDAKGVVTARRLGTAQLIATAPDGAFGSVDIVVYLAPGSTGVRLGHNEEFGEPRDGSPADDFIIRRPQYTVSYNPNRGGANWVSWNLDVTHIGESGRCSGTCYSADTALTNAGITAYTTADWVSGSTYDRGHMAPSADWTASEADNNTTFFLTNFLPQRPDLNQGPWEDLESALRDSVKTGREAYIIAGGIFTGGTGLGTLLNLGKIWIPDSTYKIVILTPAGTGMGSGGTLPANTTVMAVNMPNVQGIRSNDWRMYLTTIAKIEQSTGYNFLDLLSEPTECLAEGRNCAPTARITSSAGYSVNEGQSVEFSGATSSDPNAGDVLAKSWTVNGAAAGTGETFTYTFANDGSYEIKLTVRDDEGSTSVAVATVSVANVAPLIGAFPGATILRGETYSAAGSFTDPGSDSWSAAAHYGEGSAESLLLSGKSFNLSHQYASAGTFTVTVSVNDGAATGTRTATVIVKTAIQGIADLDAAVSSLGLNQGLTTSLKAKLANASAQLQKENVTPAVNVLEAFMEEVQALMQSGRITRATGDQLILYTHRVIASM